MSDSPDSLLGAAADRVVDTEAAITQLAKVVGLELVDIYLDQGGNPDEKTTERLAEIAGSLISIAGISVDLLKDVALLAGLNIDMNGGAPQLIDEQPHQALPAGEPAYTEPVPVARASSERLGTMPLPVPVAEPIVDAKVMPETLQPDMAPISYQPTEKSPEQESVESDLYAKICDIDAFPVVKIVEEAPIIKLGIVGNNHIKLGNRVRRLDKHELYLFNALLMLRDGVRTGAELRSFGFYPETTSKGGTAGIFSKAINSVVNRVNEAAGIELFKKTGATRGTRYIVNPNLVLEDQRDSNHPDYVPKESDELVLEIMSRHPHQQKLLSTPTKSGLAAEAAEAPPTLDEEKVAENATAIQRMVLLYQNSRRIKRVIEGYRSKNIARINPASDPIGRYLQEINEYRLLTAEDEVELFNTIAVGITAQEKIDIDPNLLSTDNDILQQVQDAVAARQILILCNMRLVVSRAKRLNYTRKTVDLMARIQEGSTGITRAIETFDPSKGWKFSTYATPWVDQRIQRAIANDDRTIRLPVHVLEQIRNANHVRQKLEVNLGREATKEEVAESSEGKFTPEAIAHLARLDSMDTSSINKPLNFSKYGERYVEDTIAGTGEADLEEYLKDIEDRRKVEALVEGSGLTPRDKFVLSARFGLLVSSLMGRTIELNGVEISYEDALGLTLVNGKGLTLEDTSKFLGVTKARVQQIEKKLLARLTEKRDSVGPSYDN